MQFVKYDHDLKSPPKIQGAAMEYPLTAVTILCAIVILDCVISFGCSYNQFNTISGGASDSTGQRDNSGGQFDKG